MHHLVVHVLLGARRYLISVFFKKKSHAAREQFESDQVVGLLLTTHGVEQLIKHFFRRNDAEILERALERCSVNKVLAHADGVEGRSQVH